MAEAEKRNIDEIIQELKSIPNFLNKTCHSLIQPSQDDLFKNIKRTIAKLNKPVVPQQPARSERYRNQWYQFKQKLIRRLERPALRYLCWESEVVIDPQFMNYLASNTECLSARSLKGLVYTLHSLWTENLTKTPIGRFTYNQVSSFTGKDRTLAKWKTGVEKIIGHKGPVSFAIEELWEKLISPKSAAENWAIAEHSQFMRAAVVFTAEFCLEKIGKDEEQEDYLLTTLLGWNGWDQNALRKIVGKLILHKKVGAIVEKLREILINLLGDPRQRDGKSKWMGVDELAKEIFIRWLSRRDIIFFFDHVLKGRDIHGRREFWLRYVDRMKSSRPLLSDVTAVQFRNNREVNFGKLISSNNQAAFILHFGNIVAIEFSNIGKIYIYRLQEFENLVPDMWTSKSISESNTLKDQRLPADRKIAHRPLDLIVNVDWREKAANILAREGIRP